MDTETSWLQHIKLKTFYYSHTRNGLKLFLLKSLFNDSMWPLCNSYWESSSAEITTISAMFILLQIVSQSKKDNTDSIQNQFPFTLDETFTYEFVSISFMSITQSTILDRVACYNFYLKSITSLGIYWLTKTRKLCWPFNIFICMFINKYPSVIRTMGYKILLIFWNNYNKIPPPIQYQSTKFFAIP